MADSLHHRTTAVDSQSTACVHSEVNSQWNACIHSASSWTSCPLSPQFYVCGRRIMGNQLPWLQGFVSFVESRHPHTASNLSTAWNHSSCVCVCLSFCLYICACFSMQFLARKAGYVFVMRHLTAMPAHTTYNVLIPDIHINAPIMEKYWQWVTPPWPKPPPLLPPLNLAN